MKADQSTLDVLNQVAEERGNQLGEWGSQEHAPSIWLTILMEEAGEAAKALLEGEPEKYRHELVQVAAVAVAAIECPDSAHENCCERGPVRRLPKRITMLREGFPEWCPLPKPEEVPG